MTKLGIRLMLEKEIDKLEQENERLRKRVNFYIEACGAHQSHIFELKQDSRLLREENEKLKALLKKVLTHGWLATFWRTTRAEEFKEEIRKVVGDE